MSPSKDFKKIQYIKTTILDITYKNPEVFHVLKNQLVKTKDIKNLLDKLFLPSLLENRSLRQNLQWTNFAVVLAGVHATKKILKKQKRHSAKKLVQSWTDSTFDEILSKWVEKIGGWQWLLLKISRAENSTELLRLKRESGQPTFTLAKIYIFLKNKIQYFFYSQVYRWIY